MWDLQKDLKKWSRITNIEKKLLAKVVVYSLDVHSLGINEKIQVRIGDKLDGNKQGMDELIKFLDELDLKDEMSEDMIKYKSFQRAQRDKNQDMIGLISD